MPRKTQSSLHVNQYVGNRIRFFRMQRGLSQQDLAAQCAITYQQLHKYENGSNGASASRLADIAEHLSLQVSDLFHGIEADQGTPDEQMLNSARPAALDREQATLMFYLQQIPPSKRQALYDVIKALAAE